MSELCRDAERNECALYQRADLHTEYLNEYRTRTQQTRDAERYTERDAE